ncbi:FGGY family carbohydrate kinase [Stomatohabitans albus]|uniref:FGGY family carbohydrate kinase n=1 Tax=Stomatohabitans albus TaxID=3110766 RepID=UPI00300CB7D5
MQPVLAIDIGNAWIRVGIVGIDGTVLASAARPIRTSMPNDGWAEQDPEHWVATIVDLVQAVRRAYPTTYIHAIGVTGQSRVVLAQHQYAIVAADTRHLAILDLPSTLEPTLAQRLDAQLVWASQAHWNPGPLHLSAHGWLLAYLGAEPVIDLYAAAQSGGLDRTTLRWRSDLSQDGWELPAIKVKPSVVGYLNTLGATLLDCDEGTPLVLAPSGEAGLIDAVFGRYVGSGLIQLGARVGISVLTECDEPTHPTMTPYPAFPGFNVVEYMISNPMAGLHWARKMWMPSMSTQEADLALIQSGAHVGTSQLVMAEIAPTTFALTGMTQQTQPWQGYLAAYEYLAFQLGDAANQMGLIPDIVPLLGIPVTHPIWPQLLADVLNRPVSAIRPAVVSLYRCVDAITQAFNWPSPAPLLGDGICIYPGPRAQIYAEQREHARAVRAHLHVLP